MRTSTGDGVEWPNVMALNITKTQNEIQDALNAVNDALKGKRASDTVWTRKIKEALVSIGKEKEKKLSCYASGVDDVSSGEWLYDLCWISYSGHTNIGCIELAMESEWAPSPKEIHDDFVKLVQARAGLRLMIWQARNSKEMEDIRDVLIDQIHAFAESQCGDAYLLSCWVAEQQKFIHKFYEYRTS